jgi:hypothetical protein
MNTNSSAHWSVKIIMVWLARAGLLVFEFIVSKHLVSRIDQISATNGDIQQAPHADISDLMAATR